MLAKRATVKPRVAGWAFDELTRSRSPQSLPRRQRWSNALGGLILLATTILWAHGCHGNEDNDLAIVPQPRRQLERKERETRNHSTLGVPLELPY